MSFSMMDMPLDKVMRAEIALPLQHVLHLFTVRAFLHGWDNPMLRGSIIQLFDSPEQARQAAAVCASWVGSPRRPQQLPVPAWWAEDVPADGVAMADVA